MAGIFLSYSRADRPTAQGIAEALEAEGFTVWWDKVLRAGQTYDEVTEEMLRNSSVVVVLWSQTSVKSKWVRAEATLGERNAVVIPAMIEDADRPIMFELTQTADLIGWEGDRSDPNWKGFISDIRRVIEPAEAAEAAPESAAAPAAPAAPAPDATIENTYWTSIQNTSDPSELESYLKRYPDGHFSDLARGRLKALTAAAAAPMAADVPDEPRAASPPPPPPPDAPPPAPAANAGSKLPLIAGAAVLGVVALVAGIMMLGGEGPESSATISEAGPSEPVTAAVTAPETEPETVDVAEPETAAETEEIAAPAPTETCDVCPQMVSIPSGSFKLGSPDSEAGRVGNEGPQIDVAIAGFEMSRTEVTNREWTACADAGGCREIRMAGEDLPAGSVSWDDAQRYVRWLSNETGRAYRLPTEAEWEYAARAGTTTAYWWGDGYDRSRVASGRAGPAALQAENPFGLAGMLGNVREWVEDCYVNSYASAPSDGRAVLAGNCNLRVIRGGSYKHGAGEHRAANRARVSKSTRDPAVGFRVVAPAED